MNKISLSLLFSLALISFLFLCPAQAALLNSNKNQQFNDNLNTFAGQTEYDTQITLENRISTIIKIILSLLGTIFLVLMFFAGSNWMQAAGNEEKVKKAQASIMNLMIGLVLVLTAYALSSGFSGLLVKILLK